MIIDDITKATVFKNIAPLDMFTWKDVTKLMNAYYYNNIALIKNGEKIPLPLVENTWHHPYLSNKDLYDSVTNGAGIVLHGLSNYNKSINAFSKALENAFHEPVDVHCYCSLEDGKESFSIHSDRTTNFIMQLDGTSDWTVYNDCSIEPDNLEIDDNLTIDINVKLAPGDVLYIPSKKYHVCKPETKRLSLSFALWPGGLIEPNRREYYIYE